MKFIDLFAGLGGFHLALKHGGHRCVFASEIDPSLQGLYERNFGMRPSGDIAGVDITSIPKHDIICAGFPCQPFSKAGVQNGLRDPRGTLFNRILEIARHHEPRYLLLENVPNFVRHDGKQTWKALKDELKRDGYEIDEKVFSPHQFGIPQIRDRVFIVGDREGLEGFDWPTPTFFGETNIATILDQHPADARKLSQELQDALGVWQDFLDRFPVDRQLPSFPIWAMEFGATYPFEWTTPHAMSPIELWSHKGAFGDDLFGLDKEGILQALPSYARTNQRQFPEWKRAFIRQNRMLYEENRSWIDEWLPSVRRFVASFQKLEWNAKGSPRNLGTLVLQTRASGIRAKRPVSAPSLVAMTSSQVPIIPWEDRYMTPRECARLQSMASLELPEAPTRAYEALGNAVNVRIAEEVAIQLLGERRRQSCSEADQSVHQTSFIGQSISENGDVLDSSIAGTMAIVT